MSVSERRLTNIQPIGIRPRPESITPKMLRELLPAEMARVQLLLPKSEPNGPSEDFRFIMMRALLDAARKSIEAGDPLAMVFNYKSLQKF